MTTAVFAGAATVALVSALLMVTRRNPIYSAVWLLVSFICVAVVFLVLQAPFLAAIHVLVYTGAILVLFLFVIMLLNLRDDELGEEYPLAVRILVAGLCAVLFLVLAVPISRDPSLREPLSALTPGDGSVEAVGRVLFNTYGLQFELVSVLIIVAMLGSMILAKKTLKV
ncbi:MAG: NADH-quinone oxidoreductase subunit J [Myxococcota bacterium]